MYVEPAGNVAANTTVAAQTQTSKQAQSVQQTSQPVQAVWQEMAGKVRTDTMDGKVVGKAKRDTTGKTGIKGNSLIMEETSGKDSYSIKESQEAEMEKIHKALEIISEQLPNTEAKFGIHEDTNRVMIKLIDKDTKEVIKEIPPEKTLDTIANCMKIAGIILDEKL